MQSALNPFTRTGVEEKRREDPKDLDLSKERPREEQRKIAPALFGIYVQRLDTTTKTYQPSRVKSLRKPEDYDGKRFIILHSGIENAFNNKAADYYMYIGE
ncbi:hypothetical protein Trydic_g89 [Trypoxylus dichotomus]